VSARAWAAFAGVSTLWGIPYLFIKVAVDDGVSPAFLAFVRVALGAAVLLAIAWRAGTLDALQGRARWLAAYAVVEISIPFPLIALGERHVASSLAAILIAAVPLIIALLALRFDHAERVTGTRLVGLLIGLGGVVALVGLDVAGRKDELLGAGAILLAAVGYAAGPMLFKRHLSDLDPRAAMGASLAIAAGVLAPFAALTPPAQTPSASAVTALVVLGLFCTAAAFTLFGALIAEVGPGRAAVITYVSPIVAVALGVTVLGERPGAGAVAGLLLILAGSWLSTGGRLPPGLTAVVTRARSRNGRPEQVERRSELMNASRAWTQWQTASEGSRSSIGSARSR
jgi:drug/metabolite transporter (DMT)-like permease